MASEARLVGGRCQGWGGAGATVSSVCVCASSEAELKYCMPSRLTRHYSRAGTNVRKCQVQHSLGK